MKLPTIKFAETESLVLRCCRADLTSNGGFTKHCPGSAVIFGTATAGDGGTATAGYGGTATAGDGGTATAGDGGILQIKFWDIKTHRHRIAIGYVGEKGLLPKQKYKLNSRGEFQPT